MANVELNFLGSELGQTEDHKLQCFSNSNNEIYIDIDMNCGWQPSFITLDIPTAIKLAKTLRTEINKAKEVHNG